MLPQTGAANYVEVFAGTTGFQAGIAAVGTDANIDILVAAKGTGSVNLGTGTSGTATAGGGSAVPATVAGFAIIKIAGITHKIPYFNI